ncbi:hypothetical protein C8Q77DRAFT_382687 [Trametes polyzona]|nr:hypothetical protein C8Q77DRAFT_382687 [Trametes polyzona]
MAFLYCVHILLLALLAPIAQDLYGAFAQSTTAVCLSGYGWMNNGLGQNPCVVSSYLLAPCSGPAGGFIVGLSAPTHRYSWANPGPHGLSACVCNTVLFSALYACAACQGAEVAAMPWATFITNCTESIPVIQAYPEALPNGTSVPSWAYLDVVSSGHLDINQAEKLANIHQPDATTSGSYVPAATSGSASADPSSSSSSASGASDTAGPTPPASSASTASGEKSKPNTSLIGGIVGGLAGAALIGVGVFFVIRRHRSQGSWGAKESPRVIDHSPHMGQYVVAPTDIPTPGPFTPSMKLYDPDEPSTYPPTEVMYESRSYSSQTHQGHVAQGGYQGRPEF